MLIYLKKKKKPKTQRTKTYNFTQKASSRHPGLWTSGLLLHTIYLLLEDSLLHKLLYEIT